MKTFLRRGRALLRASLLERPVRPVDAAPGLRRDVHRIPVDAGVEIVAYWKILPIGSGPALVVQTADEELMKFDCFGGTEGHFHIAPTYHTRLAFVEDTVDDQISRVGRELRRNLGRYLADHPRPKINQLVLNHERVEAAAVEAETVLRRHALAVQADTDD